MSDFYAYGTKMPWRVVSVIPEYPLLHVRFADEKKATFDRGLPAKFQPTNFVTVFLRRRQLSQVGFDF